MNFSVRKPYFSDDPKREWFWIKFLWAVTYLGFIRYALGGVWVTLGAPLLFVYLKLSSKESP